MSNDIYGKPWKQTYTGAPFYPLEPERLDVRIVDIAHALSLINRFDGATIEAYSVAQHCVLVSEIVPPEMALQGLLHDAAEAYVGDVGRPLKDALEILTGNRNPFKPIEQKVAAAIGRRFQVELVDLPEEVHRADRILLATEKRDLLLPPEQDWGHLEEPLATKITPWPAHGAEAAFLGRFKELYGRRA